MKVKRIISAFAALAMSVSCLAGLTITTNAAESVLTQDFSGGSLASAQWWLISEGDLQATAESEYLHMSNGGGAGRDSAEIKLGGESAITTGDAKNVRLKVDFKGKNCSTGYDSPYSLELTDGSAKSILTLGIPNHHSKDSKVTINGTNTDITLSNDTEFSEWHTLTAILDFDNHKISYSIAKTSAASEALSTGTVDMADTSATTVGGIKYHANRPYNKTRTLDWLDLDNFSLEKLVTPTITMSEDPVTIAEISGTQTVECTVTGAKEDGGVTVTAETEGIVDATYEKASNQIKLTGKGQNGVSNVTVAAESDDGVKVSKTINVTVGTVVKKDVTVKFVEKGGTTPVTGKADLKFEQAAKDSQITEEMLAEKATDYQSDYTTTDKSAKYTYDSTTSLPYTVTDQDDQVIYIYYVKHDRVNKLTVSYVDNTDDPQTTFGTQEITYGDEAAKYVGEEVTYNIPAYVADGSHKVKAISEFRKAGTALARDLNPYQKKYTLTKGGDDTVNVKYDAYDGTAYFYEAETDLNYTTKSLDTGNFSNGHGGRVPNGSSAVTAMTGMDNGKYKITYVAVAENTSKNRWAAFAKGGHDGITFTEGTEPPTDEHNYILDKFNTNGISQNSNDAVRTIESVDVHETDNFYLLGQDSSIFGDYVLFEKTADLEPESKPVTDPEKESLGSVTNDEELGDLDTYAASMQVKTISIVIPDSKPDVPKLSVQNYNGGAEFDPGWVAVTSGGSRIFYVQFRAADFSALGAVKATYAGKDIAISLAE